MKELLQKIRTTILDSAVNPRLTGGYHRNRPIDPPENKVYLYVEVSEGEGEHSTSKTTLIAEVSATFHLYGNDEIEVSSILDSIEGLFVQIDDGLSWSTGNTMSITKGDKIIIEDPDRESDGNIVWYGILSLDFMVQRNIGAS